MASYATLIRLVLHTVPACAIGQLLCGSTRYVYDAHMTEIKKPEMFGFLRGARRDSRRVPTVYNESVVTGSETHGAVHISEAHKKGTEAITSRRLFFETGDSISESQSQCIA